MRRKGYRFFSVFMAMALVMFMSFSPVALAFEGVTSNPGDGKGSIATWNNANPSNNENHIVHLKGHQLKPHQKLEVPYGLAKKGYSKGELAPYIIILGGPIEDPVKAELVKVGVKLVEYIPEFSFIALMTPEIATIVERLPFVVDVQIYQPAFKVDPSLKGEDGNIKGFGDVTLKIQTFSDDSSVIDNEIKNARAKKLGSKKGVAVVKMNRNQIEKFAQNNNVKYIEEQPTYKLYNDIAKGLMDVDDIWNLGYDGTGQVVGVCDTGLDTGKNDSTMHLDFQGRIDALYALGRSTSDDPHGHGTHVAGSVLGNGARSGGTIKGMAPNARLVFQSVLDSSGGLGGLPNDLNDLFSQAWNAGARIHTNSWGAATSGTYNTDSYQVDQYTWNNKNMIVLFAAGNEGCDDTWTNVIYNSVGTPGTAKNCITVGASENNRPSKGTESDNPNQIAIFSSRGNCADGRTKPDIVAPGTWILSTKSSKAPASNFWGSYDSYYAYMGGTSMATPLTAGAVAVARQYMINNWGITPTLAFMKAALINGATDLGFGVPSRDQGWGRVSLVNSLSAKEYKYDNETTSLGTNASKDYTWSVESANTPLRITLCWTDYPGSTSASKALVNDLDLTVTSPSGTVYYGNDFTSPYNSAYDRLNNVENVFIANPEIGNYTVTVRGYNVPNGPQPFAIFASANFGTAQSDPLPTCSITAPANGATVSGSSVAINANASDNGSISKVEFYVDGALLATDTTSPYSTTWNTTTVSNGTHTLTAKAYDNLNQVGNSSPVTVTVNNPITVTNVTEKFTGNVSKSGTADANYYIDVTAAGTVTLKLEWASSTNDLDMYLYNPSGTEVARAYTTACPENLTYNATTTGRYRVRVNAYSGSSNFTLTATHPINPNNTVHYETTDTISSSGTRYKEYFINVGSTSGTINVEVDWAGSADIDVYLYNPSGTEVAKDYSTRVPATISFIPTVTGTYKIKVDAYSGSATYTMKTNYPK